MSIEEQFYLSWPWVVRSLDLRWIRNVALLLLIVPTITRTYLAWHHYSYVMLGTNTFSRLDPILVGILLSTYLKGRIFNLSYAARVGMFITALLGLVLANKILHIPALEKTTFKDALLMFPLAAFSVSVIFVSVLGAPDAGIRWTAWPVLKYLGRISYGLYAFHRLCYVIAQSAFGAIQGLPHYFVIVITGFGLTVAVAAASYKFFEAPFLRLKDRFTYIPSERAPGVA